MKKVLKWVVIVFVALVIIGAIFGDKDTSNEKAVSTKGQSKFVLTDKQRILMNYILQNEVNSFSRGDDTMFIVDTGLIQTTATEVAKAYDSNQVGADHTYYKKQLFLTGKVKGINSGIGNEPYIVLNGTNQFLSPQVHFDEPNIDKISKVSKGQILNFVCTGGGSIVGAPMFKDCEFSEDFAVKELQRVNEDIDRFMAGEEPRKSNTPNYVLIGLQLSRIVPEDANCYTDNNACEKEIMKAMKSFKKEDLNNLKTEMKQKGLKISV